MNTFIQILITAFAEIFIENTIFIKGFGTSTMIISSKNKKYFKGLTLCVLYMTTVTSMLLYFVNKLIENTGLSKEYSAIIYVILIGLVYVVTLLLLWEYVNTLFTRIKKYVHLSAFNGAVTGALFANTLTESSFLGYLSFGIGTGLGFMLAAFLLSAVYDNLYSEDVPKSFRGYPLILIYIGILSMAFYGMANNNLNFNF